MCLLPNFEAILRPSASGRSCACREKVRGVSYLLFDLDHLHIEDESRIGRNGRRAACRAITERRRDNEAADTALLHAYQSFFPPFNDLALAQHETERIATAVVRAIEFLATALQPAGILNRDATTTFGSRPAPDLEINILQPIRRCDRCLAHGWRLHRASSRGRRQIQFREAGIHGGSRRCRVQAGGARGSGLRCRLLLYLLGCAVVLVFNDPHYRQRDNDNTDNTAHPDALAAAAARLALQAVLLALPRPAQLLRITCTLVSILGLRHKDKISPK